MADVLAHDPEGFQPRDSGVGPSVSPATDPAAGAPGGTSSDPSADPSAGGSSLTELVQALQADRLWLLRQLDSGAWTEWRLDLAALERELGELLDRVAESSVGAD